MPRCEKCGAQDYESRWQGLAYEFRCARCRWGAATTGLPPIRADEGVYRIVITSLGADPKRSLVVINRRFSHGLARTRELFSAGERELLAGDASTVLREARSLREECVLFRIEPDFPYDLEHYDAEHGHEHDWRPIVPSDA